MEKLLIKEYEKLSKIYYGRNGNVNDNQKRDKGKGNNVHNIFYKGILDRI